MATSAYSKLSEAEKQKRREYNRKWYQKHKAVGRSATTISKTKLTAKAKAKQAKEKAKEYQRKYKQKRAAYENEINALVSAFQSSLPTILEARRIASHNLGFEVTSAQTLQYVMSKYVEFNDPLKQTEE